MNTRIYWQINTLVLAFGFESLASPNLETFKNLTSLHQNRVQAYGKLLVNEHPQMWPQLLRLQKEDRERVVSIYLGLHDKPKTMSLSQLRHYGYSGSRSLLEELHGIYGRRAEGTERQVIATLNRIEDRIKKEHMSALLATLAVSDALSQALIMKELAQIERISDIVDTKLCRGQELAFDPNRFSAARYFSEHNDPVSAALATWLESKVLGLSRRC